MKTGDINTDGGGVALGANSIATGRGGSVYTNGPANLGPTSNNTSSTQVPTDAPLDYPAFGRALMELKQALYRDQIELREDILGRLSKLEESILTGNGRTERKNAVGVLDFIQRAAASSDAVLGTVQTIAKLLGLGG